MTGWLEVSFLRDVRHGGNAEQPRRVAQRLADFVSAATTCLDVAIYDFRLGPELAEIVVGALTDAAERGVRVRIGYDAGKPAQNTAAAFAMLQADPAPQGTARWVEEHFEGTQVRTRPITGAGRLMHSKYVIRDGVAEASGSVPPHAAVWTGSANFTDDAWTLQENNTLTLSRPELVTAYRRDFDQMWQSGTIVGSGAGDDGEVTSGSITVGWYFAPADGAAMDAALVDAVNAATRRIAVASMVITSHRVLSSLAAAIARGVPLTGIYDGAQMAAIEEHWRAVGTSAQALADWESVKTQLVGKPSTPYTPAGPHDFMHDKVLVCDEEVITGSPNLSSNAQHNAENQLRVSGAQLASQYAGHIERIRQAYAGHPSAGHPAELRGALT